LTGLPGWYGLGDTARSGDWGKDGGCGGPWKDPIAWAGFTGLPGW
jgi:hypothetical protein